MAPLEYDTVIGVIRYTVTSPTAKFRGESDEVPYYLSHPYKFSHKCRYEHFKTLWLAFECGPEGFDTEYTTLLSGYQTEDWVDYTSEDCNGFVSKVPITGFEPIPKPPPIYRPPAQEVVNPGVIPIYPPPALPNPSENACECVSQDIGANAPPFFGGAHFEIDAPSYEPYQPPVQAGWSDDEQEEEEVPKKVPPPPDPSPALTSALSNAPTVGRSCIDQQTQLTVNAGFGHSPDLVSWLTTPWPTWDGIPFSPCGKTNAEIVSFVWPQQWQMRGLRTVFYAMNPFADPYAPTVSEIEAWNVRVIQHYRDLLGFDAVTVENDRSLFLQSHWADERKYSNFWDASYPGVMGSAYGPCYPHSQQPSPVNPHCGATFIPSCADQTPYLNVGESCVSDTSFAEGVFLGEKDWPWCLKLSRILRAIVVGEGLTGHGGPFVSRSKVGMSWHCTSGGGAVVRIKWGGTYTNPCP